MEFALRNASNADGELAQSGDDALRLLLVPRQRSLKEAAQFSSDSRWRKSGLASARDFSAACYFFGRDLRCKLNIPIGLIAASWGGSGI
jgi:sialate O-acetylesterase